MPFAALGVTSGVLDGVLLQDASGANQPTLYILATPWCIARRTARLGEHNAEIYAELGLHREALSALRAQRIPSPRSICWRGTTRRDLTTAAGG